ncbi:MAG: HD domain-containing protein [Marinomonas gallaica]
MTETEKKALDFATKAHGDQKRKYTGEPYIKHPIAVAKLVREHAQTCHESMYCAALLHDTVEDTNATIDEIRREFGDIVTAFVDGLTDVSKPEDGNRAKRKEIDRQHLAKSLPPIQTIKLADLIDNSKSISEHDPEFAKVYMREKRLLLEVLVDGDKTLYAIAKKIVDDYFYGESK